MSRGKKIKRSIVKIDQLPKNYPTNQHSADFWEALGRAVATFGFLEEILKKATFAFSGMRKIPEEDAAGELEKWHLQLEKTLKGSLGGLVDLYANAVKAHGDATITNLDELIVDLRNASTIRNVLCHGSWRLPDTEDRALPFFVDRKLRIFDTPVDLDYLHQVQRHTIELACAVLNSVTHMGWQFPGSKGPGEAVW